MVTLIAFLTFSGFYTAYYTSVKAALAGNSALENAIRNNPVVSRRTGLALLLAALILSVAYNGLGAGTFEFFVLLMTAASLIVLLAPLRIVTLRSALVVFAVSLLVEMSNLF